MKNIYKETVEIYIDGFSKDWIYRGSSLEYIYSCDAEEYIKDVEDFEEFSDILGLEITKTIFRKKKMITIFDFPYKISVTEKDFKGAKIRFRYEKMNSYTFEYLMKNLNSEQFIEYCKDRNFLFNSSFSLDK